MKDYTYDHMANAISHALYTLGIRAYGPHSGMRVHSVSAEPVLTPRLDTIRVKVVVDLVDAGKIAEWHGEDGLGVVQEEYFDVYTIDHEHADEVMIEVWGYKPGGE